MTEISSDHCRFDHLVITAASLQQGVDWFQSVSGVTLPPGGTHPLMATHNHVSALSPNQYMEIISIDPAAIKPARPRWFSLDNKEHQQRLTSTPVVSTWVVATNQLTTLLEKLAEIGVDPGVPLNMSRGDFKWKLVVREDGTMPFDGMFPQLIEWPVHTNPVSSMQDQGIRLQSLFCQHPQADTLLRALQVINADSLIDVAQGQPCLNARLTVNQQTFTV